MDFNGSSAQHSLTSAQQASTDRDTINANTNNANTNNTNTSTVPIDTDTHTNTIASATTTKVDTNTNTMNSNATDTASKLDITSFFDNTIANTKAELETKSPGSSARYLCPLARARSSCGMGGAAVSCDAAWDARH
eukprot:179523-Rhodomonas_salina.1